MDIDTESEDYTTKGWNQLNMMFEGEDHQVLLTLINNGTIIPEDSHKSIRCHSDNYQTGRTLLAL